MLFITQGKANLRHILIFAIIVSIVGGGIVSYRLWLVKKENKLVGSKTSGTGASEMVSFDPKNCTYIITGDKILLKDGFSEMDMIPRSASKLTTRYFGNETSGDFNGDGSSDVVFILTQNTGGSGTFYYIVAALKSDDGCKGTNAVFLGDRIVPQSINFQNGEIIVDYTDRKPGEPMATTPSVGASKYLKLSSDSLNEIEK